MVLPAFLGPQTRVTGGVEAAEPKAMDLEASDHSSDMQISGAGDLASGEDMAAVFSAARSKESMKAQPFESPFCTSRTLKRGSGSLFSGRGIGKIRL